MTEAAERLIVALDFPQAAEAAQLVRRLCHTGVAFKVGLELFVAEGPSVVDILRREGASRLFLDLKFHDIPNTMAGAVRSAAKLGAWMLNVHASAGADALRASAEAASEGSSESGCARPLLIAVTVLTSLSDRSLRDELSVQANARLHALALAQMSKKAGLDGVVSSAAEAAEIRSECGPSFAIVTPGIRLSGEGSNDQVRVTTPAQAITQGASYLVVGRPITQALDPVASCEFILHEITEAETAPSPQQ